MIVAWIFTLLGCNPHAGSWVLYLEITESPNEADIGTDSVDSMELFSLADGGYAADVAGISLVGTIEANELDLEYAYGETFTSRDCDELSQTSSLALQGSISPGGGFEGTLTSTYAERAVGCRGADDNEQAYVYDVDGVKLEALDDQHPTSG